MATLMDQAMEAALTDLQRQADRRERTVRLHDPRAVNIPFPVNMKLLVEAVLLRVGASSYSGNADAVRPASGAASHRD